ncbi:MAG: Poly-beta-hydroxybutyrate polymerase [Proteobacteria bacterium]|nr:MAG: Poly-beta-hydroxybutyrate polymerase [Pseudomonadota bacterium]
MTKLIESIKQMRKDAPKPFGLYSATAIGLDGGLNTYLNNFDSTNFTDFSAGLKVYRTSTYYPKKTRSRTIKRKGRVKLLEYAKEGQPILLVPSLVNKHYIFDLYEDNSFIKYLVSQGFRPFVIDWGEPGDVKHSFNLQSLIEDYVLFFATYLNQQLNSKVDLLGYCMGGVFALIAATKQEKLFNSLTLVATPYDFNEMPFTGMMKLYKSFYLEYLKTVNVSAELIQTLFFMLDCKGVLARIKHFASVEDKDQLKRMVALEDWLSDCIAVENTIAKDVLELWYDKNKLYHEDLNLNKLNLKTLLVTANNDAIVPKEASLKLLEEIPNIDHIACSSGHIGIMVGRKSQKEFYSKIVKSISK